MTRPRRHRTHEEAVPRLGACRGHVLLPAGRLRSNFEGELVAGEGVISSPVTAGLITALHVGAGRSARCCWGRSVGSHQGLCFILCRHSLWLPGISVGVFFRPCFCDRILWRQVGIIQRTLLCHCC